MKIIFEDIDNSVRTIDYNESSILKTLEHSRFTTYFLGKTELLSMLIIDDVLLIATDTSNYELVKKIAYEINEQYGKGSTSYNLNDRWKDLSKSEKYG